MQIEIRKARPSVGQVSVGTTRKIPKYKRPFYRSIHEIADSRTAKVRRQVIEAFTSVQSDAKYNQLIRAIDNQSLEGIVDALGINALDREMIPVIDTLRETFVDAARETQKDLPKAVQQGLRFDMLNPRTVDYLRNRSAKLITNIDENTRKGIRRMLADGVSQGLTPAAIARQLRDNIGLTERQTIALDNYRRMLIAEGRNPAQVKRMVDGYGKRLLRARATTIARTETIAASNQGQEEIWHQASEQGLLSTKAKKRWIVTPDDVLCPICKEIPSINKGGVPIGALFQTSSGPVESPPAHPNCRCAIALDT